MSVPMQTLLHTLTRIPPGRIPRWLLNDKGRRFDAATIGVQLSLLLPAVGYVVWWGGFPLTTMNGMLGVTYLAVAFLLDVFIDAAVFNPARRTERIARRAASQRRLRHAPVRRPPRSGGKRA